MELRLVQGGVSVHPHALKHGLTEQEILEAWRSCGPRVARSAPHEGETVAVGWTRNGKAVQMAAVSKSYGTLIIHAFSPPTRSVIKELGIWKSGKRKR